MGISFFFNGFKAVWMTKISKGMGMSKRGRFKYQEGVLFFFFYESELMSHFVPVIPVTSDTALKGRCLG